MTGNVIQLGIADPHRLELLRRALRFDCFQPNILVPAKPFWSDLRSAESRYSDQPAERAGKLVLRVLELLELLGVVEMRSVTSAVAPARASMTAVSISRSWAYLLLSRPGSE